MHTFNKQEGLPIAWGGNVLSSVLDTIWEKKTIMTLTRTKCVSYQSIHGRYIVVDMIVFNVSDGFQSRTPWPS